MADWENDFPQTLHWNGLMPEWVKLCLCSLEGVTKALPHSMQAYRRGLSLSLVPPLRLPVVLPALPPLFPPPPPTTPGPPPRTAAAMAAAAVAALEGEPLAFLLLLMEPWSRFCAEQHRK